MLCCPLSSTVCTVNVILTEARSARIVFFIHFILALPSLAFTELSFGIRPSNNVKGVNKKIAQNAFCGYCGCLWVFCLSFKTLSSLGTSQRRKIFFKFLKLNLLGWQCIIKLHGFHSGWCSSVGRSIVPWAKKSWVWFLVRAHPWVMGSVPSWGTYERQPIDVSFSQQRLSPPLSLPPFPFL